MIDYLNPSAKKVHKSHLSERFLKKVEHEVANDDPYNTIWLDIEDNPSTGCEWTQVSAEDRCTFLQDLVTEVKSRGRKVGIYSSHYEWNSVFGSATACSKFTDLPLWFAYYDGYQNFDAFTKYPFGGWTTPYAK